MKKYRIYRSLGKIDKDIRKHELVGVEYGEDVHGAMDRIIKTIHDDASKLPDSKGYEAFVEPPEEDIIRKTRYTYEATAILESDGLPENKLIPYGIIESEAIQGEAVSPEPQNV